MLVAANKNDKGLANKPTSTASIAWGQLVTQ
jgi:hypothetical protein